MLIPDTSVLADSQLFETLELGTSDGTTRYLADCDPKLVNGSLLTAELYNSTPARLRIELVKRGT